MHSGAALAKWPRRGAGARPRRKQALAPAAARVGAHLQRPAAALQQLCRRWLRRVSVLTQVGCGSAESGARLRKVGRLARGVRRRQQRRNLCVQLAGHRVKGASPCRADDQRAAARKHVPVGCIGGAGVRVVRPFIGSGLHARRVGSLRAYARLRHWQLDLEDKLLDVASTQPTARPWWHTVYHLLTINTCSPSCWGLATAARDGRVAAAHQRTQQVSAQQGAAADVRQAGRRAEAARARGAGCGCAGRAHEPRG